ncbi:MAG: hypothetical protein DHS20C03_14980 [Minwuia thermotolerans]|nr:MAG: hypothetical protein DHS20C03_14980 [Minwuia thermotolerans]
MSRFLLPALLMAFLCCSVVTMAQQGGNRTLETMIWLDVKDSGNAAFIRDYIAVFPHGAYVAEARQLLASLGTTPPAIVSPLEHGDEDTPAAFPRGNDGQSGTAALLNPNKERRAPAESSIAPVEMPPQDQSVGCQERFAQAPPSEDQLLCVTFLESGNYTFARECMPQSYGFAGVSVNQKVFLPAGETLLLRAHASGMIQVTGDRPQCFQLAGEKPDELARYRHFVLDAWEREARICDMQGKCR